MIPVFAPLILWLGLLLCMPAFGLDVEATDTEPGSEPPAAAPAAPRTGEEGVTETASDRRKREREVAEALTRAAEMREQAEAAAALDQDGRPAIGDPQGQKAAAEAADLVAAGNAAAVLLERHLMAADEAIVASETDLQAALRAFDQQAVRDLGGRLRELKRRRDRITADLASARVTQRHHEAAAVLYQRPSIVRRIKDLAPRVDKAAAAFERAPSPRQGGRLSTLTVQEIELKSSLEAAERIAGDDPAPTGGAPTPEPAPR